MVAGNFIVYNYTIANGANQQLDLNAVVGTEMLVKITPSVADVRVLFTPSSGTTLATVANAYALPAGETEYQVGRGLSRISLLNPTGAGITVSIAVFF